MYLDALRYVNQVLHPVTTSRQRFQTAVYRSRPLRSLVKWLNVKIFTSSGEKAPSSPRVRAVGGVTQSEGNRRPYPSAGTIGDLAHSKVDGNVWKPKPDRISPPPPIDTESYPTRVLLYLCQVCDRQKLKGSFSLSPWRRNFLFSFFYFSESGMTQN